MPDKGVGRRHATRDTRDAADMKPRHAAALALVGWYLILPPMLQPKLYLEGHEDYREWKVLRTFPDYYKCEFFRLQVKRLLEQGYDREIDAECIASDDPRLKGN